MKNKTKLLFLINILYGVVIIIQESGLYDILPKQHADLARVGGVIFAGILNLIVANLDIE
jgi:hypothetical protein